MTVTLYQAGAGSGKTYTITGELVQRLADNRARPDAILATTFTRKAAAELQDRIQQRLLHPEPGDPALTPAKRLQLAANVRIALIGTVHSVGHRLLSRYAVHLGISPQLEPLEEKAQERHLRRILAEMPSEGLRELDRLARRLGEIEPQMLLLEILDEKRSNALGDDEFRASMVAGTERLIQIMSAGNSVDLPDFPDFYVQCRDMAQRVRGNGDATKKTADALEELEDFARTAHPQWQAWGKVAKLAWSKKSENDTAVLTGLARRANVHRLLHADLRSFTLCLVERVLELQGRYRVYKTSRGLVDFTDLEERLLELLRTPAVRSDLDLDLVVVDEFQDTNPIQLAIFQELAAIAKESLWVGDAKQAIFGFRGTDARLMQDVLGTIPENRRRTLNKNYRSQEGLVECVNRIFEPIFGHSTRLAAHHKGPARIERWQLEGKNRPTRRAAFLAQMQTLIQTMPPSDIAILVRKNDDARDVAKDLQRLNIPCLVQTSGLFNTRECIMVLAGLRLVADTDDALAAATLRHLDDANDTPAWFHEALANPGGQIQGATVAAVREIDAKTTPPNGVVGAVIQALHLADLIAAWGDPMRRAANLDELLLMARKYEDESEQQGKAATLTGLIYWFENLAAKKQDLLPVPASVPAIRILTLWAAKGLEWPCVILLQDGQAPDPHPFTIHVDGGNAAQGKPLEGRQIRYWPYPFGRTYMGGLNADGSGVQDAARQSPEGQTIQRDHDEETQRLLYVGFTRAKTTLILAEGGSNALDLLPAVNTVLPNIGPSSLLNTTYTAITCNQTPTESEPSSTATQWFEASRGHTSFPDRFASPSKVPTSGEISTRAEALPGDHPFPRVKTDDWQSLGQAVHAYLASLPALRGLPQATKESHAAAILARWGRQGELEPHMLVRAGDRLEAWVETNLPGARWSAEVPVAGPRDEGGMWAGTIDLVLDSAQGTLVVDHKSADFVEAGWGEKALEHAGQLACYVRLTGGKAHAVVHLPLGGGMVRLG